MNGYDFIKRVQSEIKAQGASVTIKDLLVLAQRNDPFYCGSEAQTRDAEWFAELFREHDLPQGIHLRRIHYRWRPLAYPATRPIRNIPDKCKRE